MGRLEEALARRESALGELHAHLQETATTAGLAEQQYIARIQAIEHTLHKEQAGQRQLRKQVCGLQYWGGERERGGERGREREGEREGGREGGVSLHQIKSH